MERTALARLAADEQYMHRRRLNVQNFGSGWLKPPGVPKTLHQMREEKREQEVAKMKAKMEERMAEAERRREELRNKSNTARSRGQSVRKTVEVLPQVKEG